MYCHIGLSNSYYYGLTVMTTLKSSLINRHHDVGKKRLDHFLSRGRLIMKYLKIAFKASTYEPISSPLLLLSSKDRPF